jgi:hypothetical protein
VAFLLFLLVAYLVIGCEIWMKASQYQDFHHALILRLYIGDT